MTDWTRHTTAMERAVALAVLEEYEAEQRVNAARARTLRGKLARRITPGRRPEVFPTPTVAEAVRDRVAFERACFPDLVDGFRTLPADVAEAARMEWIPALRWQAAHTAYRVAAAAHRVTGGLCARASVLEATAREHRDGVL